MGWRLARSLETLRDQIDAEYPKRNKDSDGGIELNLIRWYSGDMKHCKIETCQKQSNSKGWCKPHYDAWYRTGDPNSYVDPIERAKLTLWEKIKIVGWTRSENGCLEYNGYRNENGYGQFRDMVTNKLVRVHRIAYRELIGDIKDDEVVMHICDNPACSEPTHLQKGTQEENIKDMWSKNRAHNSDLKVCSNGHEYPIDRPKNIDKNRCRICANERNRRYELRKKGILV